MQSRTADVDVRQHELSSIDCSCAGDERQSQTSVVLLMGPTGAGKTDLALSLADRYPIEIVSVDSAMVYRGMDIGTGKPAREVLERYPHHLVDILDPAETLFCRTIRT